MYPNDHNPPHFHIVTPDHAVLIALSDLSIIAGYIPESELRLALAWARQNRTRLEDEWQRLNAV
jgi:hypothetical protein